MTKYVKGDLSVETDVPVEAVQLAANGFKPAGKKPATAPAAQKAADEKKPATKSAAKTATK